MVDSLGFKNMVVKSKRNIFERLKNCKIDKSFIEKEAENISQELKLQNDERKEIQKEIVNKVEEKITLENLSSQNAIIAADTSFHHGVIGIVASKIADKYYACYLCTNIMLHE